MSSEFTSRFKRILQIARNRFLYSETKQEPCPSGLGGIWIDVGAHLGETTLRYAQANPSLQIYAFEPNLKLAAQCWGLLSNFTVIPMAAAETDGFAEFYINANDGASSLLPLNPDGLRQWIGGQALKVEAKVRVPTVRLDTFMRCMGISTVQYLKVDAQGADLSVLRSAGERVKDIRKIKLEVATTSVRLYEGASTRAEIVNYLEELGFTLADIETQTYGQEENLTFVSERAL